jgi:hypothetical protein
MEKNRAQKSIIRRKKKAISYNSDCGQFICAKDLNFLPDVHFSFFRFLGNKSLATTSSTSQPRFISQGHTYRAVVGETLTLPCEVENIGECLLKIPKDKLSKKKKFL